jgi:hypothetical protein
MHQEILPFQSGSYRFGTNLVLQLLTLIMDNITVYVKFAPNTTGVFQVK